MLEHPKLPKMRPKGTIKKPSRIEKRFIASIFRACDILDFHTICGGQFFF
jgi:hypothetical protein